MAEAAAGALDKAIALPASLPPSLPACGAPSVRPSERVSGAAVCVFPFETSELERARSANRKPASKMAGKRAHPSVRPPGAAAAGSILHPARSLASPGVELYFYAAPPPHRVRVQLCIVWKRECDLVGLRSAFAAARSFGQSLFHSPFCLALAQCSNATQVTAASAMAATRRRTGRGRRKAGGQPPRRCGT